MDAAGEDDGWDQLDWLRLLLCAIVVSSHWTQIFLFPFGLASESAYGVTRNAAFWSVVFFFAISGLVIGRALDRRKRLGDGLLLDFMLARIQRIYPTLVVSVILCIVIGLILWSADKLTYVGISSHPVRLSYEYLELLPEVLKAIAMLGFSSLGEMTGNSNGPLWSLALEMQCYAIAGIAVQICVAQNLVLRFFCLLALCMISLWFTELASAQLLGTYYFLAFGLGFSASFTNFKLPRIIRPIELDCSYSLYVLHFPVMLFFFFAFLQGSPSQTEVLVIAFGAIVIAASVSILCGQLVERRWRRAPLQYVRYALPGRFRPRRTRSVIARRSAQCCGLTALYGPRWIRVESR